MKADIGFTDRFYGVVLVPLVLLAAVLAACPAPPSGDDDASSATPAGPPGGETSTPAPTLSPSPLPPASPRTTPVSETEPPVGEGEISPTPPPGLPSPTPATGDIGTSPTPSPVPPSPTPAIDVGGTSPTPVPMMATPTGTPSPTPVPPAPTPTPTPIPPAPTPTPTPIPPTPTSVPDRDGDGYTLEQGDCDDIDPATYPGADEVPYDGVDQDCSGSDLVDVDGDGYESVVVAGGADCDDNDGSVHPGADEACNGADDDCNGLVDDGLDAVYFADQDGDGYGDPGFPVIDCQPPDGYVDNGLDCQDDDFDIHPGASETCNGVDDDCDGEVDEGVTTSYYPDQDGDGYGDSSAPLSLCQPPLGYVVDVGDCDDSDPEVHPGAVEIPNDVDDDCNGQVDEGIEAVFEVTNDNSESLTDYQVRVDGVPASVVVACGYDFSVSLDAVSLPYCFIQQNEECGIEPSDIGLWVRIPEVAPGASVRLATRCTATSQALPGEDIFDFYDDFSEDDIDWENKWVDGSHNGSLVYAVENGAWRIRFSSNTCCGHPTIRDPIYNSERVIYENRILAEGTSGYWIDVLRMAQETGSEYIVADQSNQLMRHWCDRCDNPGGGCSVQGSGITIAPNVWYIYAMHKYSDFGVRAYVGDTFIWDRDYPCASSSYFRAGFSTRTSDYYLRMDWARLRQYADSEPEVRLLP